MSNLDSSLNALGAQNLSTVMIEQINQQQHYKEQRNADNYSEENPPSNTSTEHMEIPQSSTQLSSIDSTISATQISNMDSTTSTTQLSNIDCTFSATQLPSIDSTISQTSIDSTLDQSSQSSNSPTQSDFDPPFNPISFLNTLHQKLKTPQAPIYSFSHDPVTGQFYCQVNFGGQTFENKSARPKKQQAKEEAASIAMKSLSLSNPEITESIRQELIRAHTSLQKAGNKNNNQTIRNPYHSRQPHPLELIPKSIQWYEKQLAQATSNGQSKRPCVLLLEFCQMHKLGHPVYKMKDDGRGYYLFECTVYNRIFTPEMSFWKKGDAKDHISSIAFNHLYKEFVDKEIVEIQQTFPNLPMTSSVNGMSPPPITFICPNNFSYYPARPNGTTY